MAYEYPDAGKDAPEGVQQAIADFHELDEPKKVELPLLYHVLGDGTPAYKMSKEDAQYVDKSEAEGHECENCWFAYQKVVTGKFICSQMAGHIQPGGWCRLWFHPEYKHE